VIDQQSKLRSVISESLRLKGMGHGGRNPVFALVTRMLNKASRKCNPKFEAASAELVRHHASFVAVSAGGVTDVWAVRVAAKRGPRRC